MKLLSPVVFLQNLEIMIIKVLFEGRHDNHYLEQGGYDIFPLYSSSTFAVGEKVVLVDTGDISKKDLLIKKLKEEGLQPKDVDFVIITHFHLDHTSNVHLFPNSQIIAFNAIRFPDGRARIFRKFPENYIPEISILETPGHTLDSISVLINKDTICAGDAIRADHLRREKIPKYRSGEKYLASMKKIFNTKGLKRIIPGHGPVIEGDELVRLKNRVNSLSADDFF